MMLLKRNENWLPGMLASMFDNDLMPKMQLTTPAINIKETEEAYELELAMPGMGREDFRLRLDDQGCLMVSVEKKTESEERQPEAQPQEKEEAKAEEAAADLKPVRYLRREFAYTKFQKNFIVPENVDKSKISAKVDNGILTVEMPKMSEEDRRKNDRTIEIH
ncbi:MAG: Hsp20/alpha crystallin family protein [Bacteroidales bacterium]|nr:Hsp20/alpha crystallin family protein [Bacteroidales bacterium]